MTGQGARQPVATGEARTPVGNVHLVDPHPLNWPREEPTLELAETEVGEEHWSQRNGE